MAQHRKRGKGRSSFDNSCSFDSSIHTNSVLRSSEEKFYFYTVSPKLKVFFWKEFAEFLLLFLREQ